MSTPVQSIGNLLSFTNLQVVFPIFYEQQNRGYEQDWFCFYFDKTDKQFKILMYSTKNKSQSAYGVHMLNVLSTGIAVKTGEDIFNLLNEQTNEFFAENLLMLNKLFGKDDLRQSMHILSNMIYDIRNSVDFNQKFVKELSSSVCSIRFPTVYNLEQKQDAFGKSIRMYNELPYATFKLDNEYGLFGFDNVNLFFTLKSLQTQMKYIDRLHLFTTNFYNKIIKLFESKFKSKPLTA